MKCGFCDNEAVINSHYCTQHRYEALVDFMIAHDGTRRSGARIPKGDPNRPVVRKRTVETGGES